MTSLHRQRLIAALLVTATAGWLLSPAPSAAEVASIMPPVTGPSEPSSLDDQEQATIGQAGQFSYLIPAAANSWGPSGTRWLTELFMVNPWPIEVQVDLFFMLQLQDNTDSEPVAITVPAGAALRLNDVVGTTFGAPDAVGAVMLGAQWPLFVSSRTANHADGGTFGQLVPAMDLNDLSTGTDAVRLLHLVSNGAFRTNLGFANASPDPLVVDVDIHDSNGEKVTELSVALAPYSFQQLTDSLAAIGVPIDDAYAVIRPAHEAARYFTYASIVDRTSGDPTFVTARRAASEPVIVPAVARVAGFNGTFWRSDLVVHNPTDAEAIVQVELLPGSETTTRKSSTEVVIPAGASRRFDDALGELFNYDGVASLRLVPTTGAVMAMSRTYNTVNGHTLGQAIPGVDSHEILAAGESVELIQLRHSPDSSSGFRTNLGFTNTVNEPIIVDLLLFDDSGSFLDSRVIHLQPNRSLQINDVFRELNVNELSSAHAVVRSTTPGAGFATYASVVDNQTGDPTFVQPLPMPEGS